MVVKINQIVTHREIELFSDVDIINICITKNPLSEERFVSMSYAENLCSNIKEPQISVYFDEKERFSVSDIKQGLENLGADYYECQAPDPIKSDKWDRFKQKLSRIGTSTIASGFFFLADDISFLLRKESLLELVELNVRYLQFDIDSAVESGYVLSPNQIDKIDSMFKDVPALISDHYIGVYETGFKNNRGIFLNLSRENEVGEVRNYITAPTFSPEEARRIIDKIG